MLFRSLYLLVYAGVLRDEFEFRIFNKGWKFQISRMYASPESDDLGNHHIVLDRATNFGSSGGRHRRLPPPDSEQRDIFDGRESRQLLNLGEQVAWVCGRLAKHNGD